MKSWIENAKSEMKILKQVAVWRCVQQKETYFSIHFKFLHLLIRWDDLFDISCVQLILNQGSVKAVMAQNKTKNAREVIDANAVI